MRDGVRAGPRRALRTDRRARVAAARKEGL